MKNPSRGKTTLDSLAMSLAAGVFAELIEHGGHEHDHDCIGEGCLICLEIQIAKSIIAAMSRRNDFVLLAAFVFCNDTPKHKPFPRVSPATPVALKVKSIT